MKWGNSFERGYSEGHDAGECFGRDIATWQMAHEMRVLFCALITAHKRKDHQAFWSTVEIAKSTVGKYANFDDEDWSVFRGDTPRRNEHD